VSGERPIVLQTRSVSDRDAAPRRLREELPSSEIFVTLAEARCLIEGWRLFHNHRRIQRALGKVTPAAFAATYPTPTPLWLAALACASAPPGRQGAGAMPQFP